jgi:hypothetical protein
MQHRSSFGASSCPLSRGPRLTHFDIRFIYSNKNFLLIPASKLGRPTSLTRLVSSSKPLDFITKNSDLRVAQDPPAQLARPFDAEREVDKKGPHMRALSRTCRDHSPGNSFAVFLNFFTVFFSVFRFFFFGCRVSAKRPPPPWAIYCMANYFTVLLKADRLLGMFSFWLTDSLTFVR